MVKPFVLVVLLMGLAVGCSGNSNKADATPVASAAAPAATPDPLALNPAEMAILLALKGKNWARSEHVGKEDGKRSILFSIYAIDYVKSDEHEVPPSITVVCQGKAPWPSIDAGDLKDGNVRLRFDGGPVLRQTWKRYPHSWLGSSAIPCAKNSKRFSSSNQQPAGCFFYFSLKCFHQYLQTGQSSWCISAPTGADWRIQRGQWRSQCSG